MMYYVVVFFFFKQKTAYEMRISDWSSDVCSSDLRHGAELASRRRWRRRSGRGSDPHRGHRQGGAGAARPRTGRCAPHRHARAEAARKSVVEGKSVSVRVDPGGSRIIKKKSKQ